MFWKIGSNVKKISEIKPTLLKKLRLRTTKSRNPRLIIQLLHKFHPARVGVNFNQEQINSKIETKSCNICFHSIAPSHDDTTVKKKFRPFSIFQSIIVQLCRAVQWLVKRWVEGLNLRRTVVRLYDGGMERKADVLCCKG